MLIPKHGIQRFLTRPEAQSHLSNPDGCSRQRHEVQEMLKGETPRLNLDITGQVCAISHHRSQNPSQKQRYHICKMIFSQIHNQRSTSTVHAEAEPLFASSPKSLKLEDPRFQHGELLKNERSPFPGHTCQQGAIRGGHSSTGILHIRRKTEGRLLLVSKILILLQATRGLIRVLCALRCADQTMR